MIARLCPPARRYLTAWQTASAACRTKGKIGKFIACLPVWRLDRLILPQSQTTGHTSPTDVVFGQHNRSFHHRASLRHPCRRDPNTFNTEPCAQIQSGSADHWSSPGIPVKRDTARVSGTAIPPNRNAQFHHLVLSCFARVGLSTSLSFSSDQGTFGKTFSYIVHHLSVEECSKGLPSGRRQR